MAQKKITDLQLRDSVEDSVNIPVDDGIQTYRTTGAQFKNYIIYDGLTTKNPTNLDFIPIADSLDSFAPKRALLYKSKFLGIKSIDDDDSPYAVLESEELILVDSTGGNVIVSLPNAALCSGKLVKFKKISTDFNSITIASAHTLFIQNESVTFFSNGSTWSVIDKVDSVYIGTDSWVDSYANATTSVVKYKEGSFLFVEGTTVFTGVASGAFTVTIDSNFPCAYDFTGSKLYVVGDSTLRDTGTSHYNGKVYAVSSSSLQFYYLGTSGQMLNLSATNPFTWASGDTITWRGKWKVTGW